MIAEEVLRIALGLTQSLELIGLRHCTGLLDLELHLLGRLLRRRSAGAGECIGIIEDLVVSGLRVDRREAPRNYEVRDQIVKMMEEVPDALWDQSPVFNHHLARARRVLANYPPNSQWDVNARREQLALAENHLLDAFDHLQIAPIERQESRLALRVTQALTLAARANLEREAGDEELAVEYDGKAEQAYLAAQGLDAENTHLLENYARFKVRNALRSPAGPERTRLLLEAIALLDLEARVDEFGDRDEPIAMELAKAYEALTEGGGRSYLEKMAETSPDTALTAMARIILRGGEGSDADRLTGAEAALRRIPVAAVTWRSRSLLYHVISRRRPYAFLERLEVLDEIAGMADFVWPLQMRLEHAILLIQLGRRREGKDLFRSIRDELPTRSGSVVVPPEMRFLADPATEYREPLRTSIVVTNTSSVGRNYFGIPDGWANIDVPFRPWVFGRRQIRLRDDLDCLIQFTNFGPQAVPSTSG